MVLCVTVDGLAERILRAGDIELGEHDVHDG